MSTPCGHKKNTETVAQYRKRCGGRPLGMIMKMSEGDDKVELIKLYNKAMKMIPGSANQKKIKKQISALRKKLKMDEAPRKPRKKGQHRNSPNHSDLYTDENPKGTIKGLKFATVQDAEKSVSKIRNSGKSHAHKIQAAVAMEQRAREMGKSSQAAVYRKFINMMKKKTKKKNEGWSDKYKKSINCNNPKGFSQKAHCAGRKKRESVMEHTCHDCGQPIDINEAGFKFVIRNKKKVKKLICPPGTKSKGRKKCVRMTSKERVKREKGLKITRRKAKTKLAKTLRKRAKSMKKRQGLGLGESIMKLEELVGKPITEAQFDEAAGKKDACYRKVKARYDVWPSAYASGALVKCRKVGAKNWGNSKKEGVNEMDSPMYKITYQDSNGRKKTDIMRAQNSNLAKRDFRALNKGRGFKILSVVKEGVNEMNSPMFKITYKDSVGRKKTDIMRAKNPKLAKRDFDALHKGRGFKILKVVKESVEESYDIWAEDGSFGYTMTGIVEAEYQGRKVKLGKPTQGDSKKFKVYVKNDKGNVVKVNFGQGGDAKGGTMRIRKSNPKARKSFRARHNCDNPGPRWKARYWSCKKW